MWAPQSYTVVMKYAWISSDGSPISAVTFRSAAAGSRSPGTERKITVSANIYPGSREGNVRLDSDSELISFEIPTPHRAPLCLLRVYGSFPSIDAPFTTLRLSPLSRAFVLPLPPTLRPSALAPSSYSSPVPATVHRLRLFLNLIRDHDASLQTAPNVFPPSPFFFIVRLRNVRKINCRPVRSEMRERRTRHVGGRMKRKLGGCRFYVKSDLRVERYADDNSIKRLRCKNWYLGVSLFCFQRDLCLGYENSDEKKINSIFLSILSHYKLFTEFVNYSNPNNNGISM